MWLQQTSLLSTENLLSSKFGDVNTWKMKYWLFTQLAVQHDSLLPIESQIYIL